MHHDAHGLVVSASSDAVAAFDHVVAGFIASRADVGARLMSVLAKDPEFGLAHCMRGYLALLTYNAAMLPAAKQALASARQYTRSATDRERAHVAALGTWLAGHPDKAAAQWEAIVREYPRDVLAFRLAHIVNFWLGR